MNRIRVILILCIIFAVGTLSSARTRYEPTTYDSPTAKINSDAPYVEIGIHKVGKLGLTISNMGSFGTGFVDAYGPIDITPPSGIYPYPHGPKYLFAGTVWIGAIVGRDTLVSVGADGWQYTREMWPDAYPMGQIESHTIRDPKDMLARSEEDFIAVYTDTVTMEAYVGNTEGIPHRPLNIEITQRSFAWSYDYADDFILFDYGIKNIGRKKLEKLYIGVYLDAECRRSSSDPREFKDDISGFRQSVESFQGCGFKDTINIAWVADADGRHNSDFVCPQGFEMTSITGIRVVRTPSDSLDYSFNWWISNGDAALDFGPRQVGTPEDPFRDFGGFLGTPEGDKNKYYIMRHNEFDYDQLFAAKDHSVEGWLPPPPDAIDFANGYDTRFLLSFGPFDVDPGDILPVSFAYVAGEDFHTDCGAWDRLFAPYPAQPEAYYQQLNFSNLGRNAVWASWLYDNPGVDSDSDGYSGKYRICAYDSTFEYDTISTDPIVVETTLVYLDADTLYYEGDGVPDFRGVSPPPPPEMRVIPEVDDYNYGRLRVQWNGLLSETTEDVFSGEIDFEGYRVYISTSPDPEQFSVVASYDIEDYNKYIYDAQGNDWIIEDPPYTPEQLYDIYGIGDEYPPEYYDRQNWFYWMDSIFYFASQDWNVSDIRDTMKIHKLYPDQPPPTTLNVDSAKIHYPEELTAQDKFKYYEYEYVIKNLLPSQKYYVAVTAFDYGSPKSGLQALETAVTLNMRDVYPQRRFEDIEKDALNVIVYPNPYRIDQDYQAIGFEGREREDLPDQRQRRIHFTNLPPKCTIRIFSIDGDLVRRIDHDYAADDDNSMHESWDLITRNTQMVASGIYYWSVESPHGSQVGKLVIIL